jgi:CBS domain-containing protein
MASYLVKDYMTRDVLTVGEDASAADAAMIMAGDAQFQGYVLVLHEGRPIGIVTEWDLVKKILVAGATRMTKVTEIMTGPLITIEPDEDLLKASEIMREHNVWKLLVMRNGIVYGIITEDDVAQKIGKYVDQSLNGQYTILDIRLLLTCTQGSRFGGQPAVSSSIPGGGFAPFCRRWRNTPVPSS